MLSVIACSEDDAIRIANDSRYGLRCRPRNRSVAGRRWLPVAHRPRRNQRMTDDPQAPWGGFKYSASAGNTGSTESRRFWNRAILEA